MDITQILESVNPELLTDSVKTKIATLVEATVKEKTDAKIAELSESAEAFKTAEAKKLEEKAVEFVDSHLIGKMDEYMEYAADEYMKVNEKAIGNDLKAKMFDEILEAIKDLCKKFNIEEEAVEKNEDVMKENEELDKKLDAVIKENMALKKEIKGQKALHVFESLTADLGVSEKEKIAKLCEDYDIDDVDSFKQKVEIIKENIVLKRKETVLTETKKEKSNAQRLSYIQEGANVDTDVTISIEEPVASSSSITDGMMQHF